MLNNRIVLVQKKLQGLKQQFWYKIILFNNVKVIINVKNEGLAKCSRQKLMYMYVVHKNVI